jgi:hypothetical protein
MMPLTTRREMASWKVSEGKACGRFMSMGAQLYRPIIKCGRSPVSEMMVVQAL